MISSPAIRGVGFNRKMKPPSYPVSPVRKVEHNSAKRRRSIDVSHRRTLKTNWLLHKTLYSQETGLSGKFPTRLHRWSNIRLKFGAVETPLASCRDTVPRQPVHMRICDIFVLRPACVVSVFAVQNPAHFCLHASTKYLACVRDFPVTLVLSLSLSVFPIFSPLGRRLVPEEKAASVSQRARGYVDAAYIYSIYF